MLFWTAAPMTAQGPRKGESSSFSMRNGFPTQPARLVRGSSRRIMSMRFRPANIRVINRRVCSAVIGPAVPNKTCSRPTRRNVFPPEPPVECVPSARTVLTVKGSLRRAKQRRALDCCAPFRPTSFATGGSGGNTKRSAKNKTRQPTRGLDKVAPYQKRNDQPLKVGSGSLGSAPLQDRLPAKLGSN